MIGRTTVRPAAAHPGPVALGRPGVCDGCGWPIHTAPVPAGCTTPGNHPTTARVVLRMAPHADMPPDVVLALARLAHPRG